MTRGSVWFPTKIAEAERWLLNECKLNKTGQGASAASLMYRSVYCISIWQNCFKRHALSWTVFLLKWWMLNRIQWFFSYPDRYSGGSRRGRNRRAPPLNFDRLYVFFIQFCIRMLQNNPQIAWESIWNLRAPVAFNFGPYMDPSRINGTPCFALVMCAAVAAHLWRPLYLKILDPPLR